MVYPRSIAKILSLKEVRRVCRVTLDSDQENAFLVHRLDGTIMRFVEHECGLYLDRLRWQIAQMHYTAK